jgi:hypothetical protein
MNNLLRPQDKAIMRGNKVSTTSVSGDLKSVTDVTQSLKKSRKDCGCSKK